MLERKKMDQLLDLPWIVWVIVLPLAAAVLAYLGGRSSGPALGVIIPPGIAAAVTGLTCQVWSYGPRRYALGAWTAPLGIELYADGLSTLMLLTTAAIGLFVSIYAGSYFAARTGDEDARAAQRTRQREYFWPLWFFLWAGLNAMFISGDVFNLYVTLELLTLASVALVALDGTPAALDAAVRYLLAALVGSMAYLFGVALLYAAYGRLDLASLTGVVEPGPVSASAVALITLGLLLKTALFPLHFWLPSAHGTAPAPVSAVLSALVVKASLYLVVRLWFGAFSAALSPAAGQVLGVLGVAAILFGSLQACLAERLKMLVAYSTVAQLGYMFLIFPLTAGGTRSLTAFSGGTYFLVSHAFAKAAFFLGAGTVLAAAGHDRIDGLRGLSQRLPVTFLTFSLVAVTLMGLPPSGTFVAKWMYIDVAIRTNQGWLGMVIIGGGLLAAVYSFRILGPALDNVSPPALRPVPRHMEWTALVLAIVGLVAGLAAMPAFRLLNVGAPDVNSLHWGAAP